MLGETGHEGLVSRLKEFDELFSSNLLEAELRSALKREATEQIEDGPLTWVWWVYPIRPLTREFETVLEKGYLRGPDIWHIACALHLREDVKDVSFLSLDERQAEVAGLLGFSLE
jgi:hypothetical protein